MSLIRRLLNLGRDERLSRDVKREMLFHVEERAEELRAQGLSDVEARREARRRFGNPTFQGERTRDADIVTWLDSLRGDVRYALRALRRSPVFTSVAVASLAFGIGANTAIYTLLDAVVLRSLPVPQPEQLVRVSLSDAEVGQSYFTNPLWEQVRDRATGFTAIAAFSETEFNVAEGGDVRRVRGLWVAGDYFRLFGMRAAAGRLFTKVDDVRGCPAMAVLEHGFWLSEYAGRADAVGKVISLEGKSFSIIGVATPGFSSPEVGRDAQVYAPLCSVAVMRGNQTQLDARSSWWMRVMGRRDPAISLDELRARIKAIATDSYAVTVPANWAAEAKLDYQTRTLNVFPASDGVSSLRNRYTLALKIMMGAVALVLLIACANVANLLLARSAARQREVAIRLAIGAARRRLVRQLLTESAILALFGAVAGLFVAHWGTRGLVALISAGSSAVTLDLSLNFRVLGFTALVATITAMIFGLIPAWRGTRVSPQTAMKANARGVAEGGHARFTLGKTLVVAQVALSLTLLVGAGMFVGSLRNLRTLDPGFTAEGVLVVNADFRRTGIPAEQYKTLHARLLERVRAMPGVRSASLSDLVPVGRSTWNDIVYVDGYTPESRSDALAFFNEVSDGYFATLDTKLLAGRDFDRSDVPAAAKTAIVNEATAVRFFGSRSPLGRQFRTKSGDTFSDPYTVVGVVEDAKYENLRETRSETIYLPWSQNPNGSASIALETRAAGGDAMALVPQVRAAFADVHRAVTLDITTLDANLAQSLQREQVMAVLSALFGAVALTLSMLGLYGVMAYTVARRRNEIGVRIALGADRARVLRMVLGDVARVVLIGLVLGAAGALASGRLVTAFLFGLEPTEPAVMAGAATILLLVALGAGLLPALRASRVDPVAALRED